MARPPTPGDAGAPRRERRAPQARLYTRDQLLGRAPIRLRRRSDKARLAVHVLATLALAGLIAWWVLPVHPFTGPVLFVFAQGRGVHVGDVPALLLALTAARSARIAGAIALRLAS